MFISKNLHQQQCSIFIFKYLELNLKINKYHDILEYVISIWYTHVNFQHMICIIHRYKCI